VDRILVEGNQEIPDFVGVAAISTTLLTLLQAGDHAVLQDDLYGGTQAFVAELFQRLGIAFDFVGLTPAEIQGALTPKTTFIFHDQSSIKQWMGRIAV
jgi:cystathionine beta-lyase